MPDRDLRLNSVSRYSKKSSRLVLEEHSSCEIPAGCGGVVLRWLNPLQATPLEFYMFVNGEATFAVDGTTLTSGRPLLEFGEHVLSFVVNGWNSEQGVLMFAAVADIKLKAHSERPPSRTEFISDADGSWKYTLVAPGDDSWMRTGFDDTGWEPLVQKPVPQPSQHDIKWYRHQKLSELGAEGLGIESGGTWISKLLRPGPTTDPLWIRKVFQLTPPESAA